MTTWTDPTGAVWPVTGSWCSVCNLPMVPIDGRPEHPTCAADEPVSHRPAPHRPPFTPPRHLAGRCLACGWHLTTQGHRDDCPEETR